jgi:hypothetical protein
MLDMIVFLFVVAAIATLLFLFLRWCKRCEAAVYPHGRKAALALQCACGCRRVGKFCAGCGSACQKGSTLASASTI